MLQHRADNENSEQQKMVAESSADARLLTKVAEIYNWLDTQICRNPDLAGLCNACGRCCDFDVFDHRLFVTTPELLYLAANLHAEKVKPMLTARCPYNISGKCSIYEYRFAGCRIFCCKGTPDFQSALSESALRKFKNLCEQFQISYHYIDLPTALNNSFAGKKKSRIKKKKSKNRGFREEF
jgi:Fe-S-cluster containining protein